MASVLYRWQAPSSELYQFHTSHTSLDTVLEVFLHEDPTDENDYFVAGMNDDDGTDGTSRVEFMATEGSTYTIALDTKSQTGSFVLNWAPVNAPVVQPRITSIRSQNGNIAVEYSGVLQSAGQISGKWQDVSGASSPFTAPAKEAMQFWRTRAP